MVEVRKEVLEKTKETIHNIREKIKSIQGEDSVGERNFVYVEARDLDDLYFKTVMEELKHGEINPVEEGSHAGETRLEFPGYAGCVKYPTTEPFAPISREGIPVSTDNDAIKIYFEDYLLNGALKPHEHYRYSCWINGIPEVYTYKKAEELGIKPGEDKSISLEHDGIPRGTRFNQLEWCVGHFVNKGYGTNHCAITIGCAEGLQRYDWPYDPDTSETERGTSECLRDIILNIRRGNKLDMTTIWRSWNLFEGLPENLGGMAHLMNYTVALINSMKKNSQPEVFPGRLYAYSNGLHIYAHSLDLAKLWTNLD